MAWNPQAGNQSSAFLADWCDILFYGGERGGGKSDFQLGYQEDAALRYDGKSRGIMIRKTITELEELQLRAMEVFTASRGVYKKQPSEHYPFSNCWYWPNGASVKMRYLEHERDYGRYHGHQYSHISLDEAAEYYSPSGMDKMISTMRSAHGVPCSMRLTGNPGGVGNSWIKQRFIDKSPPLTPWVDKEDLLTYMWVPSRLADNNILNTTDPSYRSRLVAATRGNAELRKAWLNGDWDVVAGAFFHNFTRDKHVIKPFDVPASWTRIRGFDWGRASPFAALWAAVSDGTQEIEHMGGEFTIPRGALVFYREWYGGDKEQIGKGLHMEDDAVATGIARRSAGEKFEIAYSVADPSIFNVVTGVSIAETHRKNGVTWRKADNKRVAGWGQVHQRLNGSAESEGLPMIYFFDTMRETIRTLPLLQHDDVNIEDLDTNMEDHAADVVRYICMSRPYIKKAVKKPSARYVDPYA